jgi:hypothetical protein
MRMRLTLTRICINENEADLDQDVAVKNHEVGGHLRRYLDFLLRQLLKHTEQNIVGVSVIPYNTTQNILNKTSWAFL